MEFEWDDNKRQKTLFERGIDFIDAALIWDDPLRQQREDSRKDYGEPRYQTIGKGPVGILFVVYTIRLYERGKPVNRIISVRRANKKEMMQYESRTFAGGLAK
ncbi:BrnT family toxin [Corallincola platygyrae]|uniref:BrnT family toxin n=1 Tax=Corallincola platygyrae TaxID=1193278 RepID=A0ABW4XNW5_9GAMM